MDEPTVAEEPAGPGHAGTALGRSTPPSGPGPSGGGLSGTVLGDRYRLDRLIGAGGMAQVWEATDAVLGRRVAVKVLHPHLATDDAFVRRFRQEAIAAARLNDPGIVGVYDTCSDEGHEAIVMEYLEARTLRQLLDAEGPLDAATTVRLGLRILDALDAAHRAGLVHRDVKPSNILLCHDGRVKVADFGIAKADDATELTREGSVLGSATYLAPEQLTGEPVDGRTDLYALGVVLYECLTGRVPFRGESGAAVALARLHSTPQDPRRLRADVPPVLAATVMRALSRDPADRFDAAADFRAALLMSQGAAPATPAAVDPDPTGEIDPVGGTATFSRSERRWLVPALLILLVGTALTVAGLLLRETTRDEPAGPTTSAPSAPAGPVAAVSASTWDPQGSGTPGENDAEAGRATDGDAATAWRTEAYDQAGFFGDKTGVGLVVTVNQRAHLDRLRVDSPSRDWSASVFVLDDGVTDGSPPQGLDPTVDRPAATFSDVAGPVDVDLGGRVGNRVLLWITDLGSSTDGGRHRVALAEVSVTGRPAG